MIKISERKKKWNFTSQRNVKRQPLNSLSSRIVKRNKMSKDSVVNALNSLDIFNFLLKTSTTKFPYLQIYSAGVINISEKKMKTFRSSIADSQESL